MVTKLRYLRLEEIEPSTFWTLTQVLSPGLQWWKPLGYWSLESDMTVVWIDIWNLQSSSAAKNIINCQFNVRWYIGIIQGINMSPGISQYKNCWKWGHLTLSCHSYVSRCAKYYGAHITKHHRKKVWCCMENKKVNCVVTMEREPYPHIFKCINYKGDHQVDSYSCPYWHNCFNRE